MALCKVPLCNKSWRQLERSKRTENESKKCPEAAENDGMPLELYLHEQDGEGGCHHAWNIKEDGVFVAISCQTLLQDFMSYSQMLDLECSTMTSSLVLYSWV
jgi:hypothetical protein